MPKKQTYEIKLPFVSDTDITTTKFDMTPQMVDDLKMVAAQHGTSVRKYVTGLISDSIKENLGNQHSGISQPNEKTIKRLKKENKKQ